MHTHTLHTVYTYTGHIHSRIRTELGDFKATITKYTNRGLKRLEGKKGVYRSKKRK